MAGSVYQFGDFQLDCGRFELLRNGHSVRVERKPMELLILLASREGQLVTRAEIAQRLWSSEVFVDTEHGINTAIRKIRQILRDDSEDPRFIQTVTGMGYRFIAPLTTIEVAPERREEFADSRGRDFTGGPDKPVLPGGVVPGAAGSAAESARPLDSGANDSSHASAASWSELVPPPTQTSTSQIPPGSPRTRHLTIIFTASALVVFIILAFSVGPHPLAARLLHRDTQPPITSLAVLPLDNLSGDSSQEYFADGMTDELITMLARDSTLRITSRTSVMQYKGARKPLPEIARALNVDAIVEGSVSRSGSQVHMTLQLIRADSDTHLWANSYDRGNSEVSTLPAEAAQAIAARLKSTVPSFAAAHRVLPEAHDAYLQGRYFWFGDNHSLCTTWMQKAIDLQPDYALAWSGLADCYGGASVTGEIPPAEGWDKAFAAASKALELDGTLPEAHHSLAAYYYFHSWDWPRAEAESRQAIAMDPNYAEFHHLLSYILRTQNRDDEALAEQKRAIELDPFGRPWALGAAYRLNHQCDAAIAELELRAAFRQQNLLLERELAKAYWCKGLKKEWAMHMKQGFVIIGDKVSANAVEQAWNSGGEKAVATWLLDQDLRKARTQYVSPIRLALDYAGLARKEDTLRALQNAYQERSPWLTFLEKEPAFYFVHGDPRYQVLVQRIGLPPAS